MVNFVQSRDSTSCALSDSPMSFSLIHLIDSDCLGEGEGSEAGSGARNALYLTPLAPQHKPFHLSLKQRAAVFWVQGGRGVSDTKFCYHCCCNTGNSPQAHIDIETYIYTHRHTHRHRYTLTHTDKHTLSIFFSGAGTESGGFPLDPEAP